LAQVTDENVFMKVPTGFALGYRNRTTQDSMTEYVLKGETVDNWSEIATSQIFHGNGRAPDAAAVSMRQVAANVCRGNESTPVINGQVNGYAFATWIDHCPMNPRTEKPEWTVFKVIGGQDAVYIVSRAFRFEPSREQLKQAIEDVRDSFVCDPRAKEHACPAGTH
jgi:hypothetical protein